MDPGYPALITLPPRLRVPPRQALYFQRVFLDGAAAELCIANWQGDPRQYVVTHGKGGRVHRCERREEGDLLVFRTPDDWDRSGFLPVYDPKLQTLTPMPRKMAEKAALCNRVSVDMGG